MTLRPMYRGHRSPRPGPRPRLLFVVPSGAETGDVPVVRARKSGHVAAPLGPLLIAAWLGQHGVDCEVLDQQALELSDEEVVLSVVQRAPDLVGFSCFITTIRKGAKLARAIKDRIDLPILLGGPHVSAVPVETFERYGDVFDVGLVGEGELGTLRIIECIGDEVALRAIPGVVMKRNGVVHWNGEHAERMENLDDLPFPAYHLLGDLSPYQLSEFTYGIREKQVMIITSRGCPYGGENGCTFCDQNVSGVFWRGMSARRVVEAMLDVKQRGVVNIYDTDDIALVDLEREEEKARRILEVPYLRDVTWEIITRINLVARAARKRVSYRGQSLGLLELLHRAGLRQVSVAPETGNEKLRLGALQERGVTDRVVDEAVTALAGAGVSVKLLCMVGVPGETPVHTLETMEKIRRWGELGAEQAMISVCTPLPETPLARWIQAGRVHWTGDLSDWDAMTLYDPAGVFTTDVEGRPCDYTPAEILVAARGKHRIGRAVRQEDRRRKETIDDKIAIVRQQVEEHRRRPKSLPVSTERGGASV
ncbi:MAG: radical SAM protein [Deltaproteobacteria bacterium]|nr:MAG: radical SAM protein [Deltaproteobacteria bacterium]